MKRTTLLNDGLLKKGLLKKSVAATLFAFASVGVLGTGCGNVQADFCDALCECQNCGEKGLERCAISIQGQLDVADNYGCLSQAEAFFECATGQVAGLTEEQCNADDLEIDTSPCQAQRADYDDCTKDASRRDPGAY